MKKIDADQIINLMTKESFAEAVGEGIGYLIGNQNEIIDWIKKQEGKK